MITRALYTDYLTARESCLVCCLNDLTIIGLELIDLSTIREQFNSKIKVFSDHGCSIPSLPDFSHLGLLSTSMDTSSFLGRITKVVLDRQEARPNLYGTQCFKYLSLGGDW